jgi:predicted ATP-grasp superfamily ATP-dependent carboligase
MGQAAPEAVVFIHEYVTGGGAAGEDLPASWAAEGDAMRTALIEDFAAVPGVRVSATRDARLPEKSNPWLSVPVGRGRELEAFRGLAAEADYTLIVAPETGGILYERALILERDGRKSLGSTPEAIAVAGDKLKTFHALLSRGVVVVPGQRVYPARSVLPSGHGHYPAVVKPIDGAGSIDTYLIASSESPWPAKIAQRREAVFQPYVRGQAMSAACLVSGPWRAVVVGLADQRIEIVEGRLSYRGGQVPAEETIPWRALEQALGAIPGLRGWVGVDFIACTSPMILEINPRPTTSYVGYRRLVPRGALARAWLAAVADPAFCTLDDWPEFPLKGGPVNFAADGTMENEVPPG